MSDRENNAKSPVTLEELLQLKRQERPAPAFWDEFDRELRRRQLAAIVAERPWYSRTGRKLFAGLRWLTPAGIAAATAVALGFIVLHRSAQPTATAVETATATFIEPEVVSLPEMEVLPIASIDEAVEMLAEQAPELPPIEARGSVQEFAPSRALAVNFVSVSSPQTFSASEAGENVHVVPTMTRGAGYRASASPVSSSF